MDTIKVSTTMRPDDEKEVGEAEFLDLARQGLIATVNGKKVTEKQAKENADA